MISDNGPQYISAKFVKFAQDWGFSLITSSPKYPQSNGEAERMVQTVKHLLTRSDEPQAAVVKIDKNISVNKVLAKFV